MIDPEAHFNPSTTELRMGVSSFEKKSVGYKPERIDRWKNHLTRENLEMTEMVLNPDMRFFGYMPTADRKGKTFSDLYVTDVLQALVNDSVKVSPVWVDGNWIEIDTVSDLRLAEKLTKQKESYLFIDR
jgi:hypothetical protein